MRPLPQPPVNYTVEWASQNNRTMQLELVRIDTLDQRVYVLETTTQPLDADLTSWAGVTRATGFDTFAATPTSANLRALLTDESGTGAAYFQGGDIGTPSAGVLTNCTGLPLASVVGAGTAAAATIGTSGDALGKLNANKTDSGNNNWSGEQKFTTDVRAGHTSYTMPSTFWSTVRPIWYGDNSTPLGYIGTPGSFRFSMYSNAFRNNASGVTFMGANGNTTTAAGIDLDPAGIIYLRAGGATGTNVALAATITSTGLNATAIGATTPSTGAFTTLSASGNITTTGAAAGIGYATGAGGTVTQATDKTTGVTLNRPSGTITMNGAALAANATATFTLTNSTIAAADRLVLTHVATGTLGDYSFQHRCAAGSATICVRNVSAGSLSEAVQIGFAVIKGATS